MGNDGKNLELLVAELEKLLLGTGFNVSPNEKVFDGSGIQVAEFDLTIGGRVGSTSFRWLLECRDRPSQGPAPASWIQHLSGRKDLFDFDKVIAVSTTGFSAPAEAAAKKLRISIREVTSAQEISHEFGTLEFRVKKVEAIVQGYADFDFPDTAVTRAASLMTGTSNPRLRYVGENEFLSLRDFVRHAYLRTKGLEEPDEDEAWQGIFDHQAALDLSINGEVLPVVGLSVPVIIRTSYHPTKAVSVRSYGEDGAVIGEEVSLRTETPNGVVRHNVLVTRRHGEVLVVAYETDMSGP